MTGPQCVNIQTYKFPNVYHTLFEHFERDIHVKHRTKKYPRGWREVFEEGLKRIRTVKGERGGLAFPLRLPSGSFSQQSKDESVGGEETPLEIRSRPYRRHYMQMHARFKSTLSPFFFLFFFFFSLCLCRNVTPARSALRRKLLENSSI